MDRRDIVSQGGIAAASRDGAAGVTDRLWEVSDLVALLEADERGLERAA